jgi:hypothetical protein
MATMKHLILLAPLVLAACGTTNAQLVQHAWAHDDAVCTARGYDTNSDGYVRCMRNLGSRVGYNLTKLEDGQLAFVIPPLGPISQSPVWQPAASPPPPNNFVAK